MGIHTPGPWHPYFYVRNQRLKLGEWGCISTDSHPIPLRDVRKNDAVAAANARLIAAAPELLALAKWVRDNMEPLGKDPSDGVGGWRHMDATEVDSIVSGVLHFCDEAIANAEGRTDDE